MNFALAPVPALSTLLMQGTTSILPAGIFWLAETPALTIPKNGRGDTSAAPATKARAKLSGGSSEPPEDPSDEPEREQEEELNWAPVIRTMIASACIGVAIALVLSPLRETVIASDGILGTLRASWLCVPFLVTAIRYGSTVKSFRRRRRPRRESSVHARERLLNNAKVAAEAPAERAENQHAQDRHRARKGDR